MGVLPQNNTVTHELHNYILSQLKDATEIYLFFYLFYLRSYEGSRSS